MFFCFFSSSPNKEPVDRIINLKVLVLKVYTFLVLWIFYAFLVNEMMEVVKEKLFKFFFFFAIQFSSRYSGLGVVKALR